MGRVGWAPDQMSTRRRGNADYADYHSFLCANLRNLRFSGALTNLTQNRADFGVCLEGVGKAAGLSSIFVADERYDFAVPDARANRPAVRAFVETLSDPAVHARLVALGMSP